MAAGRCDYRPHIRGAIARNLMCARWAATPSELINTLLAEEEERLSGIGSCAPPHRRFAPATSMLAFWRHVSFTLKILPST